VDLQSDYVKHIWLYQSPDYWWTCHQYLHSTGCCWRNPRVLLWNPRSTKSYTS